MAVMKMLQQVSTEKLRARALIFLSFEVKAFLSGNKLSEIALIELAALIGYLHTLA